MPRAYLIPTCIIDCDVLAGCTVRRGQLNSTPSHVRSRGRNARTRPTRMMRRGRFHDLRGRGIRSRKAGEFGPPTIKSHLCHPVGRRRSEEHGASQSEPGRGSVSPVSHTGLTKVGIMCLGETTDNSIRHQYSFRKSLSNPGRNHNSFIHFVVDPSLMADEFKHLWLNTSTTNQCHPLLTNMQKLLHNNILRGPMHHALWPRGPESHRFSRSSDGSRSHPHLASHFTESLRVDLPPWYW